MADVEFAPTGADVGVLRWRVLSQLWLGVVIVLQGAGGVKVMHGSGGECYASYG